MHKETRMADMRKKIGKLVLCLDIVLVFLLLTVLNGSAAPAVPDLPANAGYSLTLSLNEKSTGPSGTKEVPISGAELTAIKVADLTVSGGAAEYTSIPAFAGLSVNYEGMTTDQSNETAAVMSDMVKAAPQRFTAENGITTMTAVTDNSGKVQFAGAKLTPGMYLILETNRTGAAKNFEIISPYLVSVPEFIAGEWITNVEAEPKMELVKPPQVHEITTTRPPQTVTVKPSPVTRFAQWVNTDDGTRIIMWSALLLTTAGALALIVHKRREADLL